MNKYKIYTNKTAESMYDFLNFFANINKMAKIKVYNNSKFAKGDLLYEKTRFRLYETSS